jgi:hypothetical protein
METQEAMRTKGSQQSTRHEDLFRAANAEMFLKQLQHHGCITLNSARYHELKRCGLSRIDVRTAIKDLVKEEKAHLTSYLHGVTVELVEEASHV